MAIARRIPMAHRDVFPEGAYIVGEFDALLDYNAATRPDGSRPQQIDPDLNLPVWTVMVVDADENAGKKDKTVTVKIAAKVQPVPPENKSGTPFNLVEFTGITATPWIDDSMGRPRLAWSIRATGVAEVGSAARRNLGQGQPQGQPQSKDAA